MSRKGALRVVMMAVCFQTGALGETIWERAKFGDRSEERLMRASIEKVLLGVADERDLLQARVGLITLSHGEIQDPRTIVLLLRMRRELGLSSSRSSKDLLTLALKGDLSLTERAWAELELAHAHLSLGQLPHAKAALDRGLSVAWRTQVRAETLILRGLLGLRRGNSEGSLVDFSEVTQLAPSRRLIVQAHIGRAFAFALRGDAHEVAANARTAFVTEATRATVSRLDPFWDLQLSAAEHDCARALLLLGRAEVLRTEEPREAHTAHFEACLLLRSTESRDSEGAETGETSAEPWGAEIKRSLSLFYQEACRRRAPAYPGESTEPESTEPESTESESTESESTESESTESESTVQPGQPSAPGADEDDF